MFWIDKIREQEMNCTRIGMAAIPGDGHAIRQSEGNVFRLLLVLVLLGHTMAVAGADDANDTGLIRAGSAAEATFRQECSSCHIVYPPSMLPTESWRNIMAGLDKHFGSDASLSDREIEEITSFLVDNSAEGWGGGLAPSRITQTRWFIRRHNLYAIPPEIWEREAVKSPANCPVCHKHAERGDFDERNICMPE